jgi:hypothetical protein
MPPIRTEFSQKSANQEGRILIALNDIKNSRVKFIRAAAKLYDIPYSTLHTRLNHRVSRNNTRANSHKLTELEEDSRGATPRRATVRKIADILLAARGITPPLTVGINWVSNFIKRRNEIRTRFSRRYNY